MRRATVVHVRHILLGASSNEIHVPLKTGALTRLRPAEPGRFSVRTKVKKNDATDTAAQN